MDIMVKTYKINSILVSIESKYAVPAELADTPEKYRHKGFHFYNKFVGFFRWIFGNAYRVKDGAGKVWYVNKNSFKNWIQANAPLERPKSLSMGDIDRIVTSVKAKPNINKPKEPLNSDKVGDKASSADNVDKKAASKDEAPMKELMDLVKAYQKGKSYTDSEFKKAYKEIMKKLGYPNGGLDKAGDPEASDFETIFKQCCKALNISAETSAVVPAELEAAYRDDLVAIVVQEPAHFNAWIYEKNAFHVAPQYVVGDDHKTELFIPARTISKEELSFEEQFVNQGGFAIYSKSKNNAVKFDGKLPNLNTCAFEASIHILAKILPVSGA